jgi:hypothetical protein
MNKTRGQKSHATVALRYLMAKLEKIGTAFSLHSVLVLRATESRALKKKQDKITFIFEAKCP